MLQPLWLIGGPGALGLTRTLGGWQGLAAQQASEMVPDGTRIAAGLTPPRISLNVRTTTRAGITITGPAAS